MLELLGLLVLTEDIFDELFVLLVLFEFVVFVEFTAFVLLFKLLVFVTFVVLTIFVVLAVFVTFVAFVVLFELVVLFAFVLFVVFVLLVLVELLEFYDLLLEVLSPDPTFKVELVVVWFDCEELLVVFVELFDGNLVELVEFCEVRFPMKGEFLLSSSGLLFST